MTELVAHPYHWGDPRGAVELPSGVSAALAAFGVRPPSTAPVDPGEIALPEPAPEVAELAGLLGAGGLRTDADARLAHTRGWSTSDLLRLRSGDAGDAPDAVVYPDSHAEVLSVLAECARRRIAVVPFAGGTSVVGGLTPARSGFRGVIALDIGRLDALEGMDEVSRTATLQAGMRATVAEQVLEERGYTLGHFPQSFEGASIGGFAAARSAGQASAGYGRFDEMVVGLVMATPRGTVSFGSAPMSAAGPDLRQLLLGSEGAFGVITSVTVRIRPKPEVSAYEGWRFSSFGAGLAAVRGLAQDGPLPTVLRLSDEAETAVNLGDPGGPSGSGCQLIVGHEGARALAVRDEVADRLSAAGAEPLGAGPGEKWLAGRYRAPYLRDALLDAGALVETLETATFWSGLPQLRSAVTDALTSTLGALGTPPLVLCHISHVYETGASLYFTVVSPQTAAPVTQWASAKAAANAAIGAAGATISHHHGVGTDHVAAYAEEVGPLAFDALRAVKSALDPAGILNPGVLISPK